jgi:hypothetical protein
MSKKNNVNPDHYKTAGRTRQGEEIVQSIHKRKLREAQIHTPPAEKKRDEPSKKTQTGEALWVSSYCNKQRARNT